MSITVTYWHGSLRENIILTIIDFLVRERIFVHGRNGIKKASYCLFVFLHNFPIDMRHDIYILLFHQQHYKISRPGQGRRC